MTKITETTKPAEQGEPKNSWLGRLRMAIKRSVGGIGAGLQEILSTNLDKITQEQVEDMQDVLIQSDVNFSVAKSICAAIKGKSFESIDDAKKALADKIASMLVPYNKPFAIEKADIPYVIILAGVNGSGKTTTIAKLTHQLITQQNSVEWAACDTFRAAAVDQMQVWADRLGVHVYKSENDGKKAEPAAVAFKAVKQAFDKKTDVLFIDTAGRLHNNDQLMQELAKIVRTIRKIDERLPQQSILVLDGSTGQNANQQVEGFKKIIPNPNIVVTKLDGTAKAGFLVGICETFSVNIAAVGIGERIKDLGDFDPNAFAASVVGLGLPATEE
ncbi:MAG: signal recognition particle-docking protein FtsY [Holosporales bacterium]|jgi:fused signal recognition particle receptor|nr:signal recognition particle-docking protein FtsY [Holosporales bacterium]